MRRLCIIGTVVALAAGVGVQAADGHLFPNRCATLACVDRHFQAHMRGIDRRLDGLNARLIRMGARVRNLERDAFVCEFVANEAGVFQWASDYGIDIGNGVVGYQCRVGAAAAAAKPTRG
jgi:hypothetical protein